MALKVYRILSFVLLPFAALFGITALLMLLVALANPSALLPVFLLSCVAIYVFTSFVFMNKGISQAKPCKASLKDWIKVNAFVSIFFCTMSILQFFVISFKPEAMQEMHKQAALMQTQGQTFPPQLVEPLIKGVLYFMLFLAITLLSHIVLTFFFIKQYAYVFDQE